MPRKHTRRVWRTRGTSAAWAERVGLLLPPSARLPKAPAPPREGTAPAQHTRLFPPADTGTRAPFRRPAPRSCLRRDTAETPDTLANVHFKHLVSSVWSTECSFAVGYNITRHFNCYALKETEYLKPHPDLFDTPFVITKTEHSEQ